VISFSEVPGLEVSPFLLLFIGVAVGVVAGFIGVGGGFMITPALIVMGFPASIAVGTGLANIAGSSVVAVMRHRQMGNVDVKLGATMALGTLGGVEVGVRFVNWLKDQGLADESVLGASLVLMAFISGYTAWETRRAKRHMDGLAPSKEGTSLRDMVTSGAARRLQRLNIWPVIYLPRSRVRISLWMLVVIGFVAGVLSGFIGVGGGFIMGPALIYLVGVPSHITVGTDLLQIVLTAGYGTVRHTMSGNVLIFASFLMMLGASVGTQIGTLATSYVSGLAVRFVLALAVGFAALGTAFELANVLSGETHSLLDAAAKGILFGGMGTLMLAIVTLLILGVMRRRGRPIPAWAQSLIVER